MNNTTRKYLLATAIAVGLFVFVGIPAIHTIPAYAPSARHCYGLAADILNQAIGIGPEIHKEMAHSI